MAECGLDSSASPTAEQSAQFVRPLSDLVEAIDDLQQSELSCTGGCLLIATVLEAALADSLS